MSRLEQLIAELCPDGVIFWELGEIGHFYGGLTGKTKLDFQNGDRRFISYMNVYKNPAIDINSSDFVRIDPGERQNTVQYGDVLFTGSSETPEECGISSVMVNMPEENYYMNSFCIGFRLNDTRALDPHFSKHLFRSTELRNQINRTANGVTRFNVSKARLAKVVVPIPPMPVQKEIVRILDTFTALELELEAELEARTRQYEYYRDALLDFDPENPHPLRPTRVNDLIQTLCPDGIPLIDLGETCEILDSQRKPVTKSDRQSGIYPYYGANGIQDYVDDYIFDGTFLLMGEDGSVINPDKSPILTWAIGKIWVNNHAHILSKKEGYSLRYLYYYLQTVDVSSIVRGVPPKINQKYMSAIKVAVPPLPVQNEIVAILDRFDALVNDLKNGLPAEIAARRKQYEYYRDQLLTFKPLE